MENASKALIIAGAILLSILIIGLGMTVYNNASKTQEDANLDTTAVKAHNSQILAYKGKQRGDNVVTLLNTIASNNSQYADRQISVTASMSKTKPANFAAELDRENAQFILTNNGQNSPQNPTITDIRNAVDKKSSTTFKVEFGYDDASALINVCKINVYDGT